VSDQVSHPYKSTGKIIGLTLTGKKSNNITVSLYIDDPFFNLATSLLCVWFLFGISCCGSVNVLKFSS
jgi:hypothetical protein